jgi:hypothetical protein
MAQLLHEPWSWSSTTPVSTSALTTTRSPPSACTAGRIISISSSSAAWRSARSWSLSILCLLENRHLRR